MEKHHQLPHHGINSCSQLILCTERKLSQGLAETDRYKFLNFRLSDKAIPPSRLRKQDGGNYFCIVMLFILSEKQFLCYPCAPLYSVAQRMSISSVSVSVWKDHNYISNQFYKHLVRMTCPNCLCQGGTLAYTNLFRFDRY